MIKIVIGLLPFNNKNTFPWQTDSSSSSTSSDGYLQAHLHAVSKLYTVSRKAAWASLQLILDSFCTNFKVFNSLVEKKKKNHFSSKQSSTNRSWESVSSRPRRLENFTKIRVSEVKHSSLHTWRFSSASCLLPVKRMLLRNLHIHHMHAEFYADHQRTTTTGQTQAQKTHEAETRRRDVPIQRR